MRAHTRMPGYRVTCNITFYNIQIRPHLPTFSGVYTNMWICTQSQAHSQISAGTAEYDPEYVPRR